MLNIEYLFFFKVSEQGYRDCFRPHNASTLMVDCVPPYSTTEFTQEIVDFTGVPGGKDFKPGQSYYIASEYISASLVMFRSII